MKTLFRFLFRNTARQLTADALNVGVMRGFDMGRQYEYARLMKQGIILDTSMKRDIEAILAKARF